MQDEERHRSSVVERSHFNIGYIPLRLVGQKRWIEGGHFRREEGVHEEEELLQLGTDDLLSGGVLLQGTREVELQSGVPVVRGSLQTLVTTVTR